MPAGAGHSFGRQGTDGGSCAHRGRKRPRGHSGTRRRDRAARPRQVLPFGRYGHSGSPRRRRLDRPSARRSRCSGRTAPASRRRSTCCSAWPSPTPARVSVFGHDAGRGGRGRRGRRDAADRRADPRPHRARAGRDDGARSIPRPLAVDEVLELTGIAEIAEPAHAEAVRRPDAARRASRSRWSATPTCSCSTSRRWRWTSRARRAFWTTMREFAARGKTVVFATHYLEEADAYADRVVLMAHGRVVADGPTTEIKAMVGTPHDPGDAARTPRRRRSSALPGVTRAERHGEAVMLACSDSDARDPRAARALSRRRATSRSRGAGLEEAFLQLTGEDATTAAMNRADLHPLRAAADVPQPPLLHLLAGLPARPLLPDRRAEPERGRLRRHAGSRRRSTTWSACGVRDDERDARRRARRIAAERSVGWNRQLRITPLSPRDVLPRQGADRLPHGRSRRSSLLYVAGIVARRAASPAGDWLR